MTDNPVTTYTVTEDAERIDRVARDLYGSERGATTETLLTANRRLSGDKKNPAGDVAFGTILSVPAAPEAADETPVRPWE
ncbi:hypothetical protein [Labrenzia sp. OB1]|uniref:hypothetical protein n=1 Tax=Labrenzia sp. OB1 TaxID=1561204 RepID=UPI0007B283FA|nr:hypothetical protein [Labrenzia sp. OB1]KZM49441.1 hypothetical protein OA90_15300 [Labrenzia sp. OB1]